MDREGEEMQFMGIADIWTEAYRIILRRIKIFKYITFVLILPLSGFIFIAHGDISSLVFSESGNLPDFDSFELGLFWFSKLVYFSFLLIFFNLSTSMVVFTVSAVYRVGVRVSLKKVISVVPRAWKRLTVTFLCNFSSFLAYNISTAVITTVLLPIIAGKFQFAQEVLSPVVMTVYVVGFVYMTIIWQLANVVSVLEDSYGFEAMIKSKELVKGKLMVAMFISTQLTCSFALIQILFGKFVLHGQSEVMLQRIAFGLICFCSLCALILFGLIIQTIIYFVCKSYHLEKIDESTGYC